MTTAQQKAIERSFVERAATALGVQWQVGPNRECPDFTITEAGHMFGLEVMEVFAGRQNDSGSLYKRSEVLNQRIVGELQELFEREVPDTPLSVRLVGDLCLENRKALIEMLIDLNLSIREPGFYTDVTVDRGNGALRAYVTRSLKDVWYDVYTRVGWLDPNPMKRIEEAVEKKSRNLGRYRLSTHTNDIRLLVYANRSFKSGMLPIPKQQTLNLRGFRAVYFFSYPESAVAFR